MSNRETLLIVGAPLSLAILEAFHPHAHDLLQGQDVERWLVIHYVQIVLFPLAALALAALVRGRSEVAAAVCRVSAFLFATSYVAFDTAAGVVTGILVKKASAAGTLEAWRPAIDAIWKDPIVGGAPMSTPPVLAVLGSCVLSIGAVAAAISLRREGVSWGPLLLLSISSFGIAIFQTHAWPGGPLTFGGMALAAAWLTWERARAPRTS